MALAVVWVFIALGAAQWVAAVPIILALAGIALFLLHVDATRRRRQVLSDGINRLGVPRSALAAPEDYARQHGRAAPTTPVTAVTDWALGAVVLLASVILLVVRHITQ